MFCQYFEYQRMHFVLFSILFYLIYFSIFYPKLFVFIFFSQLTMHICRWKYFNKQIIDSVFDIHTLTSNSTYDIDTLQSNSNTYGSASGIYTTTLAFILLTLTKVNTSYLIYKKSTPMTKNQLLWWRSMILEIMYNLEDVILIKFRRSLIRF